VVDQIKAEYEKLSNLTNDELRAKTVDFKERIKNYLADIDQEGRYGKEDFNLRAGGQIVQRS